jgi:hypothetical protein
MVAVNELGAEVLAWMQAHPRHMGYELAELAGQFRTSPERMRDQLQRLVNAGRLRRSEPVTGMADANPSYILADV